MRTILHCRVSSKEQEESGYSLDAQEKLLREYATSKGLEIAKVYRISESASGKQIRKLFNEMLAFATKEKIQVICCEKIDRLTRNLKDAATINEWVHEKERQVHFVKESFVLSRDTRAHENLVWDMKVAIARFYTNNLSEEVRKGQKEKIAQGWKPSRAPLGYKTVGESGHKIHKPDEKKAPFIRRAFELYATGNYSLSLLNDILYKEGLRSASGRKLAKSNFHLLLSNPFYCGQMVWKGETMPAQHQPLISVQLYNRVQEKLGRKINLPQFRKHLPVFKGRIQCEGCQKLITWETHKGHWYGHCNRYHNCPQSRWWRQEKVESGLFAYFDLIAPKTPYVLDTIRTALQQIQETESEFRDTSLKELEMELQCVQRRMEALYDDKLDGTVPLDIYAKKLNQYSKEKDSILLEMQNLNTNAVEYYKIGVAIHELAYRAKEIYLNPKSSTEDKRLLMNLIFSNLSINADEIRVEYTKAFQFLAEWVPRLNAALEPENKLKKQGRKAGLSLTHPTVLAFQDCFRTFGWSGAIADCMAYESYLNNLLAN